MLTVFDEEIRSMHTYETYVPGKRNSHDTLTCTTCLNKENVRHNQEDAEMVSIDESIYEPVFESVGFGTRHDGSWTGNEYDSTCNGIQDIIISGTVCSLSTSSPFYDKS